MTEKTWDAMSWKERLLAACLEDRALLRKLPPDPSDSLGRIDLWPKQTTADIAQHLLDVTWDHVSTPPLDDANSWCNCLRVSYGYYIFLVSRLIWDHDSEEEVQIPIMGPEYPFYYWSDDALGHSQPTIYKYGCELVMVGALMVEKRAHLAVIRTLLAKGQLPWSSSLLETLIVQHDFLTSLTKSIQHARESGNGLNRDLDGLAILLDEYHSESLRRLQLLGEATRRARNESTLRFYDLPFLARRHPSVLSELGAGAVGRIFEEKLHSLFQSFGFFAVVNQSGQRAIDLVCIAPDGNDAFIVEAKTSSKPYALPTRHSRALIEHVRVAVSRLRTLPPIRFLLIVGGEGGANLSKKLKQLELEIGVPTRFIDASDLLRIREEIAGPFPPEMLVSEILDSNHVVGADIIDGVRRQIQSQNESYDSFLQRMLKVAATRQRR